jgi:hypothetical protein
MKLIRHTVSGPASSMSLVCIGNSGGSQNLRAVFQSPGNCRHKVAFACLESELKPFLRVLETGVPGEKALIGILRDRGFLEAAAIGPGCLEIRYEIHPSRSRGGTKGVVVGQYKPRPVKGAKPTSHD